MKKLLLLIIVVAATGLAIAAESDGQLHGTVNLDYNSRYIWRGFDYYANDHSAVQASADVSLYGTGFGVKVLSRRAISSGFENSENLNVTLYYGNSIFGEESYKTNYTVEDLEGWTLTRLDEALSHVNMTKRLVKPISDMSPGQATFNKNAEMDSLYMQGIQK